MASCPKPGCTNEFILIILCIILIVSKIKSFLSQFKYFLPKIGFQCFKFNRTKSCFCSYWGNYNWIFWHYLCFFYDQIFIYYRENTISFLFWINLFFKCQFLVMLVLLLAIVIIVVVYFLITIDIAAVVFSILTGIVVVTIKKLNSIRTLS